MSVSFGSLCDDFYVNMTINTELDLPTERDTILHFFDRIQRQFPTMNTFCRRETGEYCLDEDREAGNYRWATVEKDRICSGAVNPASLEESDELHHLLIEQVPHALGVNHLDINSLDVLFGLDFDYMGNHDEILAEALFKDTAFTSLLELPYSKALGFEPTIIIGLSEDCRLQARISAESRTGAYQLRTGKFKEDDPLSLYLSIRQYPDPATKFNVLDAFNKQRELCVELMNDQMIPYFVNPILEAIAQRQ
ncbi:MAG: hypothetical protein IID32_04440 [Planctomycetes bacterium]|nr:hypothetical protein [Planctomycetota bacterium]